MIKSYRDKRTERFSKGEFVKVFEPIAVAAERRLALLDEARSLDDLNAVPGNGLEVLRGDRKGQHSIRVNKKWRICFVWNGTEGCAEQVELTDYH